MPSTAGAKGGPARFVLADTSALAALFNSDDQWHKAARTFLDELKAARRSLLATTDIFDEVVTCVRRWCGYKPSVEAGRALQSSGLVTLVSIDDEIRKAGWTHFEELPLPALSLTDCTSFAVMDRFGLRQAFTFDSDFRKAGYEVLPGDSRSPRRGPRV